MSYNLTGLRKAYVDNKRIRIVFLVLEQHLLLIVVAINKREKGKVYQITRERIEIYKSFFEIIKDPEIDIDKYLTK